jgi:hypothetical protein
MKAKEIENTLEKQGRTKRWLSKEMKMPYSTLRFKFRNDTFSFTEMDFIKRLLNIKE